MESDILLRSLILVGGRSTRMGFPKHLLCMSLDDNSHSLLLHIAKVHRFLSQAPDLERHFHSPVTISVRDKTQQQQVLDYTAHLCILQEADIVVDVEVDVGPTAGLLSAHRLDPSAHWIVTGCDYPSITTTALRQLVVRHLASKPGVTCFVNDSGVTEPLLAIWSPASLTALERLLGTNRRMGPNGVISRLMHDSDGVGEAGAPYEHGVETVTPEQGTWIQDVNTPEEWQMRQGLNP